MEAVQELDTGYAIQNEFVRNTFDGTPGEIIHSSPGDDTVLVWNFNSVGSTTGIRNRTFPPEVIPATPTGIRPTDLENSVLYTEIYGAVVEDAGVFTFTPENDESPTQEPYRFDLGTNPLPFDHTKADLRYFRGQTTEFIVLDNQTVNEFAINTKTAMVDQDDIVYNDAWGNIASGGDLSQNNRLFNSKEIDATGLVYFGYRYYDPEIGRFINRDLIGFPDGPNNYLFANNDPVNKVNKLGKNAVKEILKDNPQVAEIQFNLQSLRAIRRQLGTEGRRRMRIAPHGQQTRTLGRYIRAASAVGHEVLKLEKELQELTTDAQYGLLLSTFGNDDYGIAMTAVIQGTNAAGYKSVYEAFSRDTIFGCAQGIKEQIFKGGLGIVEIGGVAIPIGRLGAQSLSRLSTKASRLIKTGVPVTQRSGVGLIDDLTSQATKNADASEVILGKYSRIDVSYDELARQRGSTHFSLKNWDNVSKKLGNDQMWSLNERFLNQQWKAGKDFYFSHNPWTATGSFEKEVLHLIDLGVKDFTKAGNGLWKAVR